MEYSAEISRDNPSCMVFLIDQSGSMGDSFGGEPGRSKAERLADAINRLLFELGIKCTKDQEEGVRNYYDIAVIGYGQRVGPAWGGSLAGQMLVPVHEVSEKPARLKEITRDVEDQAGGLRKETIRLPVWFEPVAQNGTPMCDAFNQAFAILEPWVQAHRASFPPIVINISDGEPTDGDPTGSAERVSQLRTNDGPVLIFNCHISHQRAAAVLYPDTDSMLPDEHGRQLFRMSSILPPHLQEAAKSSGYAITPQSRGFVFNVDMLEVIKFLDIGTRAKGLR